MKKNLLLLCCILILQGNLFAIHNGGGEITYRHIQFLQYEIKIVTYTKTSAVAADRPSLDSIHFGDGTDATFPRVSYIDIANDIRVNTYIANHSYLGPGIYRINFIDPNRNDQIVNIPQSINAPMYIDAYLVINPFLLCPNNSVVFDTVPVFFGQLNRPFTHNLTARDPDHDSLSYELISCQMAYGVPAPGYYIPNNFSVNSISGQIKWNTVSGDPQGAFNFAVRINEWRNNFKVGHVMREFQITMLPMFTDTLNVFAPLTLPVDASGNSYVSVNPGDTVNISAIYYFSNISSTPISNYGEAFQMTNPPIVQYTSGPGTASAGFYWIPDSAKSRPYPYIFQLRGTSNSQRQSDLTFLVYVNGANMDPCQLVGMNEFTDENILMQIFPNPATNELIVQSTEFKVERIEMWNVVGRRIKDLTPGPSPHGEGGASIDVSELAPGIYFVALTDDAGNRVVRRVVKM